MINSLIINALNYLNIPIRFQTLLESDGNPDVYITFFEFNQTGALHGDDQELKSRHSVQVDILSKGDYTDLANQVKNRLLEIGFTRSMETEFYEDKAELYHKVIRFNFVQ